MEKCAVKEIMRIDIRHSFRPPTTFQQRTTVDFMVQKLKVMIKKNPYTQPLTMYGVAFLFTSPEQDPLLFNSDDHDSWKFVESPAEFEELIQEGRKDEIMYFAIGGNHFRTAYAEILKETPNFFSIKKIDKEFIPLTVYCGLTVSQAHLVSSRSHMFQCVSVVLACVGLTVLVLF
jgi:hypothetical protein